MKRKNRLFVSSLLIFALQAPALAGDTASPYPADAEASISLPPADTYADRQARKGGGEGSERWGVGQRQQPTAHDPFPFGGGYQDD